MIPQPMLRSSIIEPKASSEYHLWGWSMGCAWWTWWTWCIRGNPSKVYLLSICEHGKGPDIQKFGPVSGLWLFAQNVAQTSSSRLGSCAQYSNHRYSQVERVKKWNKGDHQLVIAIFTLNKQIRSWYANIQI